MKLNIKSKEEEVEKKTVAKKAETKKEETKKLFLIPHFSKDLRPFPTFR